MKIPLLNEAYNLSTILDIHNMQNNVSEEIDIDVKLKTVRYFYII